MNILDAPRWMRDNVPDGAFRIPHDNPPKVLLVLTAYLDESGQEQDDWMFIAGYMGDDAAWKKFPLLWLEAIGPQRKHLHMKDLRFTKQPVRRMLQKAALVPKQCGLTPIVAGVRFRDYVDVVAHFDQEDYLIHSAYVMCCKAAAIFAMRSLPPDERVEIVLERQDRYGWYAAEALQSLSEFRGHPELLMSDGQTSKLASWRVIDKKDTVLCDPADYLAYALLQQARNKASVKSRWTYPIVAADPHGGAAALVQREHARGVVLGAKKEQVMKQLADLKQLIMKADAERIKNEEATPKPRV